MSTIERNDHPARKEIAFLNLAASGQVSEACEKHIDPDFRHHNPYFKGDAKSIMKPADRGMALVHIFRFRDHMIVELWDMGSPCPRTPRMKTGCSDPAMVGADTWNHVLNILIGGSILKRGQ